MSKVGEPLAKSNWTVLLVDRFGCHADAGKRAGNLRVGEFAFGKLERESDVLGGDGRAVIERQPVAELDDHSLGARQKRP